MMKFWKNEDGQGLVEYGLILGLIAVVAIVLIIALGNKTSGQFESINKGLDNAEN